jgi:hypothetical protein
VNPPGRREGDFQTAKPEGPPVTAPGRELYIYWRMGSADAAAASLAIRAWQLALQKAHPGLRARLLRRADEAAAEVTLMETYLQPGGIDPALQQHIADAGDAVSAAWRRGPRHLEVFIEPG